MITCDLAALCFLAVRLHYKPKFSIALFIELFYLTIQTNFFPAEYCHVYFCMLDIGLFILQSSNGNRIYLHQRIGTFF